MFSLIQGVLSVALEEKFKSSLLLSFFHEVAIWTKFKFSAQKRNFLLGYILAKNDLKSQIPLLKSYI
jgi:hypothetical protein